MIGGRISENKWQVEILILDIKTKVINKLVLISMKGWSSWEEVKNNLLKKLCHLILISNNQCESCQLILKVKIFQIHKCLESCIKRAVKTKNYQKDFIYLQNLLQFNKYQMIKTYNLIKMMILIENLTDKHAQSLIFLLC